MRNAAACESWCRYCRLSHAQDSLSQLPAGGDNLPYTPSVKMSHILCTSPPLSASAIADTVTVSAGKLGRLVTGRFVSETQPVVLVDYSTDGCSFQCQTAEAAEHQRLLSRAPVRRHRRSSSSSSQCRPRRRRIHISRWSSPCRVLPVTGRRHRSAPRRPKL